MPQTIPCPACGYRVEAGVPVCGNCGNDLTRPALEIGEPARPHRRPGRWVGFLIPIVVLAGARYYTSRSGDEARGVSPITSGAEATPDPNDPNARVAGEYAGVRELVGALRAGGLRCVDTDVVHHDAYVSTGTCRAGGTYLQINVFFTRATVSASAETMRESPFTYVHDENWWVTTQPAVARTVKGILGGKLVIGSV